MTWKWFLVGKVVLIIGYDEKELVIFCGGKQTTRTIKHLTTSPKWSIARYQGFLSESLLLLRDNINPISINIIMDRAVGLVWAFGNFHFSELFDYFALNSSISFTQSGLHITFMGLLSLPAIWWRFERFCLVKSVPDPPRPLRFLPLALTSRGSPITQIQTTTRWYLLKSLLHTPWDDFSDQLRTPPRPPSAPPSACSNRCYIYTWINIGDKMIPT